MHQRCTAAPGQVYVPATTRDGLDCVVSFDIFEDYAPGLTLYESYDNTTIMIHEVAGTKLRASCRGKWEVSFDLYLTCNRVLSSGAS
jgi:hypothetical protein